MPIIVSGLAQTALERSEIPRQLTRAEVLDGMAINARIPIANGFMLVPDYPPTGEEDEYIPKERFTWYFSNGMAPYASSGQHVTHDRRHGPSYYQLFQSPSFAACIKDSAGASYNLDRSFYFTSAMDILGDSHVLLTNGVKPDIKKDFGLIQDARLRLQRLIRLRDRNYPLNDPPLTEDQEQLFSRIWHETDFAELEAKVGAQLQALPAHAQEAILGMYAPGSEDQRV
jgi:hypothetical protein